jgi:hypothetical protein
MRYIHISARLATTMVNGNPQTYVVRPGATFNAGRNAEKRAARRREKLTRLADVSVTELLKGARTSTPKRIKSRLTIDMLADRRLRQRGGESDPRAIGKAA